MTTEEAFIKVLQMHGIEHAFGIIGSAIHADFRPFPKGRESPSGMSVMRQCRDDGRRFHPRLGQDVHDDRPERSRHHQLRHAGQDRLLESHAAAAGDRLRRPT
jgi:hypothetical protein